MNMLTWVGTMAIVATLTSSGTVWGQEAVHEREHRQLAQAPATILGEWRCDSSLNGAPVVVIETYTTGNYTTVILFQGQQLIVGGNYTAVPVAANSLQVSYRPANWRPRQVCSGPGGVGGNCVPFNPEPTTDQLFFPNPDTFQRPQGSCRRQK